MKNPYRVVAGLINTSHHQEINSQISLGIKAVFHPNPLIAFVLIKVNRRICIYDSYFMQNAV